MKRLSVLMICRRYWPYCDDGARRIVSMASGLRRQGVHVTVLTPRAANSWPAEIVHREIPVVRPTLAPRGDWSMGRYARNLSKWVRQHIGRFHLLYCDSMRDESAAVLAIARQSGIPVVMRCGSLEGESDVIWATRHRTARRAFQRCMDADAIVASRAAVQQALLAAGAQADVIVRIADGIGPCIDRNANLRRLARHALSEINADLCVPRDGRVILCTSRLAPGTGVDTLTRSIVPLLEDAPLDRLWLVGDGPWRSKIYNQLKQAGAHRAAFLPGSFDHIDDVMQASDLFVLPSASEGVESYWQAAISAALPSAIVDCSETRAFTGNTFQMARTFPPDQPPALTAVIKTILADLSQAEADARRIRATLQNMLPLSETLSRHMQLFERLTTNSSRRLTEATG